MLSRRRAQHREPVVGYLAPFGRAYKAYVEYACGLEGLTVACLQYESNQASCTPTQRDREASARRVRSWAPAGCLFEENGFVQGRVLFLSRASLRAATRFKVAS